MTLRRRTPLKRTALRRTPRSTSYSRRPRDVDYMGAVKGLPCLLSGVAGAGPCEGPVEADHAGDRGFSQKSQDGDCIPLCAQHHRHRTGGLGGYGPFFGAMTKDERRHWCRVAIARTQLVLAEKRAGLAR